MVCSIPTCSRPAKKRGWCSAHYERWRRHGDPLGGASDRGGDPMLRFWLKVNQNGPVPEHRPELGPCWVWTAALEGSTRKCRTCDRTRTRLRMREKRRKARTELNAA